MGLTALALTANMSWAQCSTASLQGTYAFTVHGQSITVAADGSSFTSTGLIDGVGSIDFDGHGNITQSDYVIKNGTLVPGVTTDDESGFHTGETGTYAIYDHCTGTAHIVLGPGNERFLELVIADNGRSAHAIVSSSIVNGSPALLQVYSDFQKLGR
jgi:predicted Zn-dependent protease